MKTTLSDVLRETFKAGLRGEKTDTKFIIVHETLWASWLTDIVTFSGIIAVAAVNHTLGWDSWVLDLFAIGAGLKMATKLDNDSTYHVTSGELVDMVRRIDKGKENA